MSNQAKVIVRQPLKTFTGADKVLELYPDRLIVRRTDAMAKILPSMYVDTQTIDLKDIREVYLLDSKYAYSRWLMFVLHFVDHKHLTILYDRKNFSQAQDIKKAIDDFISKREPFPSAHV